MVLFVKKKKKKKKRGGVKEKKKKKKGKVLRHLLRPIFTLRLELTLWFFSPITNNIFPIILSLPIIHY